MWKSTQCDASLHVRVGDDGVHKLVVRGGDAVEVDRDVVTWLERSAEHRSKVVLCGGKKKKGVVANIAEAGYCNPAKKATTCTHKPSTPD